MHVIVSKQTIDSFDTIRIYIQYLAYLISDEKEHNPGSVSFHFFDFLCPDNILKTDYNILWADKFLFLDKNSAFNFFERFTELYIIVAYDFPPNIKIRDFQILDSNDLYSTFYNKKKLGKSFPEKYKSLGIQLNDPRSYNSFSCIQVILNIKKYPFAITWKDNFQKHSNYKKYMPTKRDIAEFKTGNKEIQNFVSVYKNPIVFFVGNSPSYFYWVNPQPKWFLLPISGRMMHNKLDEPTEKQCINMCKYITSKIKPDISNIIVVDKSNGDSIQGVITFLKSKCKLNKPINFLNTWDIQGIEETIEKIRLQEFIRLMPQLPYYNWNKIGSIEKVIQKHIEQKPVKEFLKKIRF